MKGIGEVKSTLNKVEFTKALVKLARNKLLYQERKGRLKSEERRFSENSEIFSFLVCNKLSFDITKIDFDEVINRTKIYKDQERKRDENCNLLKQAAEISNK